MTESAPGRLERRDGIAWLVLDEPGKKVNTLSSRLFDWFEAQLAAVEAEPPLGLVIVSGKRDGFVAGADVGELRGLTSAQRVRDLLDRGHALSRRLERLPFPTVAAIHGAALGGGLELALCCGFRVATDHPKTKLGLPEVQLGLVPGMGGTQRLPRLIGKARAKDLILTARRIDAAEAERIGLVNAIAAEGKLMETALEVAAAIAANGPVAVRAAKRAIDEGCERPLPEGLEIEARCYKETLATRDRLEALAAFAEKRKPRYVGS
jgi:enoyl-CoA hydratase/carnithine racemase